MRPDKESLIVSQNQSPMGFDSGGRDRGFRRRASSSRYRDHLEEFLISSNDSVAADIARLIDTYY